MSDKSLQYCKYSTGNGVIQDVNAAVGLLHSAYDNTEHCTYGHR